MEARYDNIFKLTETGLEIGGSDRLTSMSVIGRSTTLEL